MDKAKEFNGAFDPQLFFDQLNGKVKMGEIKTEKVSTLEPHRKSIFANNARGQFLKMALQTFGATAVALGTGIFFNELNERGIPVAGMAENAGDGGIVPLATATDVATATATAESTATATDIPLPQGPISELQKTLGDEYRLTPEGDHFTVQGTENLKIFEGGWAEFTIGSDVFTVSNLAVTNKDGALTAGGWQFIDGEATIFGSGAPSAELSPEQLAELEKVLANESLSPGERQVEIDMILAEWEAKQANFVMDEGASPEVQAAMEKTLRDYVRLVTEKTAASEFEEVFEEGVKVESEVSDFWVARKSKNNDGVQKIQLDTWGCNQLIALKKGYAKLAVYGADGKQKLDLRVVPIVVRDTDGTIFSMVGLIDASYFPKLLKFLNLENRFHVGMILITAPSGKDGVITFASKELQEFMFEKNQELIAEDVLKDEMNKLPDDLDKKGFWAVGV